MKRIKKIMNIILPGLIFFLVLPCHLFSQKVMLKSSKTNVEEMEQVINSVSDLLRENYIFPDKTEEMSKYLKDKFKGNEYNEITDSRMFAQKITEDLRFVSKDKHISVMFNPEAATEMKNKGVGSKDEEYDERDIIEMRNNNFGFKKVEILDGNIGYIDLTGFAPSKYSKETITSAMGFLANCDAIIFDVRNNGGGDPTGVQMISSYFFSEEPVHLNDLYFRSENKTDEFWTLKEVPGKRMPEVDLYVLTSNYIFSGAEEFSYNLKNLKRATIIGEVTGGGAHPVISKMVNDNYVMFVPNGIAINPVTKTNWEGVGVIPDIEIDKKQALEKTHTISIEKMIANTSDPSRKNKLQWKLESLKAEMNPLRLDVEKMKEYTGNFGEREIILEEGQLYYQRKGRPKMKMIVMGEDIFKFDEAEFFRLKFEKDSSGKITAVVGIYDNGMSDRSEKN